MKTINSLFDLVNDRKGFYQSPDWNRIARIVDSHSHYPDECYFVFDSIKEISDRSSLNINLVQDFVESNVVFAEYIGKYVCNKRDFETLSYLANKDGILKEYLFKKYKIFSGYRSNFPIELYDYICFHDTIDIFCWLIKLRYATKDMIKSNKYSLLSLFDQYLQENKFKRDNIKKLIGTNNSKEKFTFHLLKGWHDEMVRNFPLEENYLDIGTNNKYFLTKTESKFFSWNIIQTYYSIFEYNCALTYTNKSKTDLQGKNLKDINIIFNNNILGKLSNCLIKYPLNLSFKSKNKLTNFRNADKEFWKYKYSSKYGSIYDLEKTLIDLIEDEKYFSSFLYNFRVWANYQGIETIYKIQDGHFLNYLYKNLGIINFFYASLTEIMAISFLGEDATIAILKDFDSKFLQNRSNFSENIYYNPIFLRFRLYKKNSLLNNDLNFTLPKSNDPLCLFL